jgi:hypothetical protein
VLLSARQGGAGGQTSTWVVGVECRAIRSRIGVIWSSKIGSGQSGAIQCTNRPAIAPFHMGPWLGRAVSGSR